MPSADLSKTTQLVFEKAGLTLEGEMLDYCTSASSADATQNISAWATAVAAVLSVKSSERQARGLERASWVLAGATVALVLATLGLIAATLAAA